MTSFAEGHARRMALGMSALSFLWLSSTAVLAASCPTVADPQNLKTAFPEQAEIDEAAAAGVNLSFKWILND